LRLTYEVLGLSIAILALTLGLLVFFGRPRAAGIIAIAGFALPYVVVAAVFDPVDALRMLQRIASNWGPIYEWLWPALFAIGIGAALRWIRRRYLSPRVGST
jgi:hypothetical protein